MISREELQLLISGAVSQGGAAIESVEGRRLTRTELDELGRVMATLGHMIADRCAVAKAPPPPPASRERRHATHFNPLRTAEFRAVSAEDIAKATKK